MENRIDKKKDKADKLSNFSAVLTQLRKERGISQKKAALDLGISQALLSHYEKGIRECGLDFVIKCGEYYGVTTDYLLGVSNNRNGVDTSLSAHWHRHQHFCSISFHLPRMHKQLNTSMTTMRFAYTAVHLQWQRQVFCQRKYSKLILTSEESWQMPLLQLRMPNSD